jgi:thymidine phosphorylase
VAKLAGAPRAPMAGVDFHAPLGSIVKLGQPLYTVHAETPGELAYALDYAKSQTEMIEVGETT